MGASVSRLSPLVDSEFTWALLNSDNTCGDESKSSAFSVPGLSRMTWAPQNNLDSWNHSLGVGGCQSLGCRTEG